MARNFYKDRFAVKGRRARQNRDEIDSGSFEDPAVDAFNLRKDANAAAAAATDQYEADVAAYKATEATAAEEGIASLPQFSGEDRDAMDSGSYDDSFVPPAPSSSFIPTPVETNPYAGFASDERDAIDSGAYDDGSVGDGMVYGGGTPVPPGYGDPYYDYNNNVDSEEPDLSSGTDGMVNMFGGTEPYGGDVQEYIDPDPVYQPPVEEEPIFIPRPPPPIEDGRPRNIYTGKPIRNPYVPYEEPSKEMAEYTRPMRAENFGSTPGMGPQINPPREPIFANNEPIFANNGGNLDKGLSRLPLNQQNDTLTQIFQAGFRPRR